MRKVTRNVGGYQETESDSHGPAPVDGEEIAFFLVRQNRLGDTSVADQLTSDIRNSKQNYNIKEVSLVCLLNQLPLKRMCR